MKDPAAFLTIGELSDELGLAQHILRYWEGRFPALRPLTRGGGRRYYRPADADLARRINHLLNVEGYTVKGVQKLLAEGGGSDAVVPVPAPVRVTTTASSERPSIVPQLRAIRDRLARALAEDDVAARI